MFGNDWQRNVHRLKGKEFHVKFTKKTVKQGGENIIVWECSSWYGIGTSWNGIRQSITETYGKKSYASENMEKMYFFFYISMKHLCQMNVKFLGNMLPETLRPKNYYHDFLFFFFSKTCSLPTQSLQLITNKQHIASNIVN